MSVASPLSPPSSREKILDVAEALLARRGFSGVGLREVAMGVGLGKSSLFHHFPSKVHLYLEVLERSLSRIQQHVQPALQAIAAPARKMDLWLDALTNSLVEHPTTARLLLRELFEDHDFPAEVRREVDSVERTLMSILGGFQAILREGIEAGVYRAVDVRDATQTMIGTMVYHFASGELGESITGGPLFSAQAVARRKREMKIFLHGGLAAGTVGLAAPAEGGDPT